jgi:hypothetical protein
MKKVLSILLAFIFLISTLGISVAIGYCPKKKNHSFSLKSDQSCCCKKSHNDSNCCNSTKISFEKIKDNYVASGFQLNSLQYNFIVFNDPSVILQSVNSYSKGFKVQPNNKPPEPSVSLNILYRSILI